MVAAATRFATGRVYAQSGPEVLKAKGCLNCHDLDKQKVGPAYKDVAAKYKGKKGAEKMLVSKRKEGKGHPIKIDASDPELKAAAETVLSALHKVAEVPAQEKPAAAGFFCCPLPAPGAASRPPIPIGRH